MIIPNSILEEEFQYGGHLFSQPEVRDFNETEHNYSLPGTDDTNDTGSNLKVSQ